MGPEMVPHPPATSNSGALPSRNSHVSSWSPGIWTEKWESIDQREQVENGTDTLRSRVDMEGRPGERP